MNIMDEILKAKKIKGLSWQELAENLPISGEGLRIAFKRNSVDQTYLDLICEKLNLKNQQSQQPHADALVNTNGNKFTELPDGTFDIEVKELPFTAYASYLESLETGHATHDLNTVTFNVDRYGRGHYMAFTIKGDSMNGGKIDDTPDGAKVLGRELGKQHWKSGFHDNKYGWIILCKENIFHKDIIDFDPGTGYITCHSRNPSPEYADFKLNLNNVYQIFKVIKRIF